MEIIAYELHSDNTRFDDIVVTTTQPETVIGRSRAVSYRVMHPQISGVQCELIWIKARDSSPPKLWLTDWSSNGTFVDGAEVGKNKNVVVAHGSVITFLVPSVEDVNEDYGDEIPSFVVHERRAVRVLGAEEAVPAGTSLLVCERLREPPAAELLSRAGKEEERAAEARRLASCKSEAVHGRVLRKRPAGADDAAGPSRDGPDGAAHRAKKGRGGASMRGARATWMDSYLGKAKSDAAKVCHLLRLSGDVLNQILSCLDTPSMLAAAAACTRLGAEAADVERLSLRTLRTPLTLDRTVSLFGRFNNLRELSLDGRVLASDGSAAAASALLPGLHALSMRGNTLMCFGAGALASALERVPPGAQVPLAALELSASRLCLRPGVARHAYDDEPVVRLIRQLAKAAGTLTSLTLSDNEMRPRVAHAIVASPAFKHLTTLDLSRNHLGHGGVSAVADALSVAPAHTLLTRLQLDRNFAGDLAAASVASMLRMNRTLLQLSLAHNAVGHAGGAALADALEVNSRLVEVDLSYNTFLIKTTHDYSTDDMQTCRKLRAPIRDTLSVYIFTI